VKHVITAIKTIIPILSVFTLYLYIGGHISHDNAMVCMVLWAILAINANGLEDNSGHN